MVKLGKLLSAVAVLYALACAFFLFPHYTVADGAGELYECEWAEGSSKETLSSLLPCIVGMDIDGNVALLREGAAGRVKASLAETVSTLLSGSAAEVFTLQQGTMSALERVAFTRSMLTTVLYSDGLYRWTGEAFLPAEPALARSFLWLDGSLPAGMLARTEARELAVHAEAEFSALALAGSFVERVFAQFPYAAEDGAVYLSATGGRRLVGALPAVTQLSVHDISYADAGALLPCTFLTELELPFVGNSAAGVGSLFEGMLAHLFRRGNDYEVPSTLQKVRVHGGSLIAHAFYRCHSLTEIDACGVDAARIERDAFIDCTALERLHTPREDVSLTGTFRKSALACGCTLYERA